MLLAIDIGNTNTVLGLFHGEKCVHLWRLSSDSRRTADEYAFQVHQVLAMDGVVPEQIAGVVIGSVVPVLSRTFDAALRRSVGREPFHVTHDVRLPVRNKYRNPHEVGIDRLANAAGGIELYGAPLIVVDLGTAVTLDVVSKNREYLGGAILPGIEMSAESLARRTARLPLTSPDMPGQFIGRTTVESIRSGIFHGLAGSVDHLVAGIWKELGYRTKTVATGGLAGIVVGECRHVRRENPELTLVGLKRIHDMNTGRGAATRPRRR